MDFAGPEAELEVIRTGNAVTFRSVRRRRWIDLLWVAALALGVAIANQRYGYWVYGVALLGIILWVVYWVSGKKSDDLWMTESEFVSSLGGPGQWSEFYNIEFRNNGEDEPSGLYGIQGWGVVCLLPHLDEEQTLEVIEIAFTQFPKLLLADPPETRSFFGKGSEPITLGLTKPRQ